MAVPIHCVTHRVRELLFTNHILLMVWSAPRRRGIWLEEGDSNFHLFPPFPTFLKGGAK
jgi:hypothetical protein